MTRSPSEMLAAAAPPPPPGRVVEVVRDLERILALPRRPPLDCERDPKTKLLRPEVQALVEVVTAKYGRGPRLSCACRPRVATRLDQATVALARVLPEVYPPEVPVVATLDELAADWRAHEAEARALQVVRALRPGQQARLPAADGEVGHPCVRELNPIQAWVLWEAPKCGGVLGYAGVGSGKSILAVLLPLAFPDCRLAVVLIEPSQRRHYRSQYLRAREHFRVPSIVFDDGQDGHTVFRTPPLHVVPYSRLSNHSTVLDQLDPDLLVADEAHRIAARGGKVGSARTRRTLRYFSARIARREAEALAGLPVRDRAVRFVPMSGTLETKSIKDSQRLAAHALGEGSPLPIDPDEAEAWSAVIDPSKSPDRTSSTARALRRAFAGEDAPAGAQAGVSAADAVAALLGSGAEEAIRRGFRERRRQTPGVITASAQSIGASIYLAERRAPPVPEAVRRALAGVRDEWLRPDGDEIVERAAQVAIARQVASGMYYYWAFLGHKCACRASDDKCAACKKIDDWYAKRKAYFRELRVQLERALQHLDSPRLCENAARRAMEIAGEAAKNAALRAVEPGHARCAECLEHWPCSTARGDHRSGHLPAWASERWSAWADVEDTVPHEQRVRWIGHDQPEASRPETHPGYYLARDAAEWARTHRGVVWYQTDAVGRKIAELAGLPCHGGGPGAEEAIRAERGDRSVVASIKAHGSGRDGLQQLFSEQLIVEMPASNHVLEQCLDEHTEVLTTKGWLSVHSCEWRESGLYVAAYSINDSSITWSTWEKIERPLMSERMYGISNEHLDIRVTAGHRMICEVYRRFGDGGKNGSGYRPRAFFEAAKMPLIGRIPVAGLQEAKGIPLTDSELLFIGLVMTDGNINGNVISLFQSEKYPEVIDLIERVLKDCNFKYGHEVNKKPSNFGARSPLHKWTISKGIPRKLIHRNMRGWGELEQYISRDFSPQLESVTRDQLLVLLQGMWAGDGSKTPGTYSYDRYTSRTLNIATRKEVVANRLQSLCVRRGMRCNITFTDSVWMVRVSPNRSTWGVCTYAGDSRPLWRELSAAQEELVWCVKVGSGAIVTRRFGKVAIVGNCLGRLHREGQRADVVRTEAYFHYQEARDALRKATEEAEFVLSTQGVRSKILLADVDVDGV